MENWVKDIVDVGWVKINSIDFQSSALGFKYNISKLSYNISKKYKWAGIIHIQTQPSD